MPEVTLEMMEYGITSYLREPGPQHDRLGSFANEQLAIQLRRKAAEMRVKLTTHVLADKLPPVEVDRKVPAFFAFPRSPFQHWKQKHADAWWLRRFVKHWPVRTTQHTQQVRLIVHLERFRTYPEASIQVPPNDGLLGRARFGYSLDERIERTP